MEKNTEDITREIIDSSVKAGQDILQSVSDAINKNDYSKLASEITDAVKAVSIPQRTIYSSGRKEYYQHKYSYNQNPAAAVKTSYPFFAKKVSRYDGVLSIVFSSLVGFFGALPLLICGIVFSAIFGGAWLWMLVTGIASMGACLLWLFSGIKKLKLAKLFHKFGNIIKDKEYFKVSELAQQVVKTDKEVTKDLKEMVKAGYLPRAKFDSTETTFMITDAAYQMYLGAEKDRLAREKKELDQQKASLGVNATTRANLTGVEGLIAEGEDYIRFVRATNDIIPDTEQMSDKLYRLENIMNRIFEKVKKNPGSADDLHKLMNYYLPTTKKLLDAYVELDKQAGVGENVQQTKAEISTAMDTINEAFEKLLDSMFQDMAWDISSDISVMKTMMAQDGLTTEGQGMAMRSNRIKNQIIIEGKVFKEENMGADLQFDAAPAAPSLSFGAEEPQVATATMEAPAEEKKDNGNVALEAQLSEEELKQVEEFSKQIDITNSTGIMNYGVGTQKKLADFSEKAIDNVKTKDMGEVGDMITDLVTQLKNFEIDEDEKGLRALFKKGANKIESLKAKYSKVETNVQTISNELERHQVTLMKDVELLDRMYDLNLNYYKELSMYILAGKKRLEEERSTTLVELQKKAAETGLPEDAEKAKDFANKCDRFEKKIYDLELTRTIAMQTGPQIRMVQSSNTVMAEKIQSTIVNTIPLWKNQMVIAIGIEHATQAAEAEREVNDMTNKLLRKNADALKVATIESAKEAERGIVDIETLKHTNESLISTLDEVLKIQTEGKTKRREAEAELAQIESQLKDKLLEAAKN